MINFRYIKYSDDVDAISGFALCYQDKLEWDDFFKTLVSGFEAGIKNAVGVEFRESSTGKYSLIVTANGKEKTYKASITGIDSAFVTALINDLKVLRYLFIITAVNIDVSSIEINKHRYYCFQEMTVDGKKYTGATLNNKPYPIDLLKDLVD